MILDPTEKGTVTFKLFYFCLIISIGLIPNFKFKTGNVGLDLLWLYIWSLSGFGKMGLSTNWSTWKDVREDSEPIVIVLLKLNSKMSSHFAPYQPTINHDNLPFNNAHHPYSKKAKRKGDFDKLLLHHPGQLQLEYWLSFLWWLVRITTTYALDLLLLYITLMIWCGLRYMASKCAVLFYFCHYLTFINSLQK